MSPKWLVLCAKVVKLRSLVNAEHDLKTTIGFVEKQNAGRRNRYTKKNQGRINQKLSALTAGKTQ